MVRTSISVQRRSEVSSSASNNEQQGTGYYTILRRRTFIIINIIHATTFGWFAWFYVDMVWNCRHYAIRNYKYAQFLISQVLFLSKYFSPIGQLLQDTHTTRHRLTMYGRKLTDAEKEIIDNLTDEQHERIMGLRRHLVIEQNRGQHLGMRCGNRRDIECAYDALNSYLVQCGLPEVPVVLPRVCW